MGTVARAQQAQITDRGEPPDARWVDLTPVARRRYRRQLAQVGLVLPSVAVAVGVVRYILHSPAGWLYDHRVRWICLAAIVVAAALVSIWAAAALAGPARRARLTLILGTPPVAAATAALGLVFVIGASFWHDMSLDLGGRIVIILTGAGLLAMAAMLVRACVSTYRMIRAEPVGGENPRLDRLAFAWMRPRDFVAPSGHRVLAGLAGSALAGSLIVLSTVPVPGVIRSPACWSSRRPSQVGACCGRGCAICEQRSPPTTGDPCCICGPSSPTTHTYGACKGRAWWKAGRCAGAFPSSSAE